jgi:hypothetical protein
VTETYAIERTELEEEFAAVVYADGAEREGLDEWLPGAFEATRAYLEKWGAGPKGDPFLRIVDGELVAGRLATTPVGGEGDVEPTELPAGPAATTVHEGGDDTVEEAYAALRAWVAEQGGSPTEEGWEVFPGGDLSRRIVVLPFA